MLAMKTFTSTRQMAYYYKMMRRAPLSRSKAPYEQVIILDLLSPFFIPKQYDFCAGDAFAHASMTLFYAAPRPRRRN